ncbi:hypothetical protein FOYG_07410 [Fusarium oxysporum NRRL 32931]|uniref:AB hydrolase-1 domain-containing protein n=1 Tax=Fusarium oxysporum NRRL 32931 TaxID=660029 RepID=W9I521_FUSOX|nr:hypothetical protein FOYG_07410 [Fusarium oxysporum NRRL 32931]
MQSFLLDLPDGGTISGRIYLPANTKESGHIPLLVCIPGGSYDSDYFDVDPRHSIFNLCTYIGIPVISVDRPGYGTSKSPAVVEDDETYAEVQGRYFNSTILPSLWNRFAKQSNATTIVLLAHSIGAMMAIIAAGSYYGDHDYPLAGLIVSGIGSELVEGPRKAMIQLLADSNSLIHFDTQAKDAIMLQWPLKHVVGSEMCQHTERLNKPIPREELRDINMTWLSRWRQYTDRVTVPVMHGLGEYDGLWISSRKAIEDFQRAFPRSPRVNCEMIPKAPHCVELSFQSKAWYLKCCGFAFECAVSRGLEIDSNQEGEL